MFRHSLQETPATLMYKYKKPSTYIEGFLNSIKFRML